MLKVNVGMSRKVSKDYNSTGFSINLEGDVAVSLDDPPRVVEKIKELYDFAEETLSMQIERYESESAIASHDRESHQTTQTSKNHSQSDSSISRSRQSTQAPLKSETRFSPNTSVNASAASQQHGSNSDTSTRSSSNGSSDGMATNKQLQFMMSLAKRQGMNQAQLEERIEGMLGKKISVYDLSKQDANVVITELNEKSELTNRRS